jgi:hypothetical protein
MANLLDNRRRCDQKTSRCHFSSVVEHRGNDCVHFCTGFIQKKTLSITGVLQIFHTKLNEISRTLRLMHDGISFDQILPR